MFFNLIKLSFKTINSHARIDSFEGAHHIHSNKKKWSQKTQSKFTCGLTAVKKNDNTVFLYLMPGEQKKVDRSKKDNKKAQKKLC